jgi:hypothetical protein
LKNLYSDKLTWFSNTELRSPKYEYLPEWLPDSFIKINLGTVKKPHWQKYLLTMFDESTPFFVMVRRVKSYISYFQTEDWEDSDLPPILLICPSLAVKKRLRKQIIKQLNEAFYEDELRFYLTTKHELLGIQSMKDKVWQNCLDEEEHTSLLKTCV